MGILSRDDFFKADVAPILELVEVPELGGSVHVGVMSAAQRDRFEAAYTGSKAKDTARALMAAFTVRDEANRPFFTEADVPKLKELSGIALDRIFKVAFRLNKLGEDAVEAEAKNSEPTP